MPSRPLNRCPYCDHEWYPRGHDSSRKCPHCGRSLGPRLTGGCVALAVIAVAVAIAVPVMNRGGKPGPKGGEQPAGQKAGPTPGPETGPKDSGPQPPPAGPAAPGGPDARGFTPAGPAVAEVAPPPRRVGHRLPPSRWSSEWQRVGNARVRVYSAALERVALVADGRTSESPGPALVVWVEVENLAAVPRRVRAWQDPFAEYAELKTARGVPVGRARFGSGVRVRDLPEPSRDLEPGEPPVAALVLFEPPPADAGVLTLRLDAARVGEAGAFAFTIPAGAWSGR